MATDPEILEIPLSAEAQTCTVDLGDATYTLTVKWNEYQSIWILDIRAVDGVTPVILNIPMQAGVNLLGQFPQAGVPGVLFVYTDGAEFDSPTFDNLGGASKLYWTAG